LSLVSCLLSLVSCLLSLPAFRLLSCNDLVLSPVSSDLCCVVLCCVVMSCIVLCVVLVFL
jgi:hypothetical protein